jgi:hypothetical protein
VYSLKSLPVLEAVHEHFAEQELVSYKQMVEMDPLVGLVLVVL